MRIVETHDYELQDTAGQPPRQRDGGEEMLEMNFGLSNVARVA